MNVALSIDSLVKTYDDGTQAVKDINLEVKQGEFFWFAWA